jgi:hypothetical protein
MQYLLFKVGSDYGFETPATGWFRLLIWLTGLLLVLCQWQEPKFAAGREFITVNPYKVEAAFLRNFAHYVTGPSHAFAENDSPWHIGILGPDPFRDFLESTFEGRTEQDRSFEIFRADRLDELPPCQILFIAFRDVARRRATLNKLKDKPVLTVGEASDFLNEGGIIRFHVGDRVSMSVNLDQARHASLSIQTKMLEVSEQVIENGVVRKMR